MNFYYRHFPIPDHSHLSHVSVAGYFKNDTFYCGLAFCSKHDQFSRPKGRAIAEARLQADPLSLTKETVTAYILDIYPALYKKDVFLTHVDTLSLQDFNINILFEAFMYKLIKGH